MKPRDRNENTASFLNNEPTKTQRDSTEYEIVAVYHITSPSYRPDSQEFHNIGVVFSAKDSNSQSGFGYQKVGYTNERSGDKTEAQRLLEEFRSRVSNISEVAKVEVLQSGEKVDIWTFIDERDLEVREKIYDIQLELLEKFSGMQCEFHVLSDPSKAFSNTQTIYRRGITHA